MIAASAGMPPPLLIDDAARSVPVQADHSGIVGDFTDRFSETSTRLRISGRRLGARPTTRSRDRPEAVQSSAATVAPATSWAHTGCSSGWAAVAQGDVWKAAGSRPSTNSWRLKVLKPSLAHDPARMAQFRREAERGLRLVGPSLLTVYELSEIDGYHFMAMPYVEGDHASRGHQVAARLPCSGDDEAHHPFVSLDERDYLCGDDADPGRGHRGPGAAFTTSASSIATSSRRTSCWTTAAARRVYLCDFGLGRDLDVATPEQMRDGAGTPMYMAPERLLHVAADEIKCDIYSMGVTLFEALDARDARSRSPST